MTGVEDIIENLAEARNTSVQVDAKSMAEFPKLKRQNATFF